MKRIEKYIVVPFRLVKGRPLQAEMRQASSEAAAIRLAEAMAGRFAGVAAFEVRVDIESGEMFDPRELVAIGTVPSFEDAALQAA